MAQQDLNGGAKNTSAISEDSVKKLQTIREQLKQDQIRYLPDWREISSYVNPAASDWDDLPPQQTRRHGPDLTNVYDTTAQKASARLADGIQGYAFARNAAWLRLAFEDKKLDDVPGAGRWLQAANRSMLAQLQRSNFYDEGRTFIKCGADFGTAIMFRQDDDVRGIPAYSTLHLKRALVSENIYGEVDTLFRDFFLTGGDAIRFFGRENLPEQIRAAGEDNKATLFRFTHMVFPHDKYDLDYKARGNREYYSFYVATEQRFQPVAEGGYDGKPFFCWRWARSLDGDVWGTDSPGQRELPTIKQANGQRKDISRMNQLAARPPIKATETLNGRIRLEPNGVTLLRPGEDYALSPITAQIGAAAADLQELQQNIRESYHTDFFLLLTEHIERMKTATEVSGLQGEKAAMLSSFFGRLGAEFLEPVIEDLFALEGKAGRLPQMPAELVGKKLKIDFDSPLAQMQMRFLTLTSSQQAIGELLQLSQINPNVIDKIDFDAYADIVAEAYGLDKRVLRDQAKVEQMRQARAKLQAQQMAKAQQLQEAQVQADVMQKMGTAPQPGSPVEKMMNPQQGENAVPAGPQQ